LKTANLQLETTDAGTFYLTLIIFFNVVGRSRYYWRLSKTRETDKNETECFGFVAAGVQIDQELGLNFQQIDLSVGNPTEIKN
jgi:hypothetical protein